MDKMEVNIDFDKMGGLVPAIIQDADTAKVLMLGFMNREAYAKTMETGKVTFYTALVTVYGRKARKVEISCM